MLWFLTNQQRVQHERACVTALGESTPWLTGASWALRDEGLVLDFDVQVNGRNYEATMIYPKLFPHSPPIVRPRQTEQRWSAHQYLDGTLCLEWGQDTWSPEVSGAQVIESLHRLLETENPANGEQRTAPSRHQLTRGQEIRGTFTRFYVTGALAQQVHRMPAGIGGTLRYGSIFNADRALDVVLTLNNEVAWTDTSLASAWHTDVFGTLTRNGVFFITEAAAETILQIDSIDALRTMLPTQVPTDVLQGFLGDTGETAPRAEITRVLIRDGSDGLHLFRASLVTGECVLIPQASEPSESIQLRLPSEYTALHTRSVGVVGLGSLGGKVAASLARSGTKRFVLVDDDILLPGNVCRHTLDWRGVLAHKAQAVADALGWISSDVSSKVFAVNLTGQESPTITDRALEALAGCDLIVDATADAEVFNLLAGISNSAKKVLVWGQVFAGGIGGFVARSRPGKDPTAYDIRAGYHTYCLSNPAEDAPRTLNDYATEPSGNESEPLIASDADVTVIGAHLVRFALDALLETEPSLFSDPMYLIGLRRAWVFNAPFHTLPLRIESANVSTQTASTMVPETLEFLMNLLAPSKTHESNTPTDDPA